MIESKNKLEKPVFIRQKPGDDGKVTQPILRLNKAEMDSPRWNSLFRKRLSDWLITKPYHRMGTTNEIHKGIPSKCTFCLKRGEKDKVKTEKTKSKKVKKTVKRISKSESK